MQKTYSKNEIPEFANEKCAVIYALEIIGGKWKLPIIWKLSKKRLHEVQRAEKRTRRYHKHNAYTVSAIS